MADGDRSRSGDSAPAWSRARVEQDFVAGFEAIGTEQFFDFMVEHFSPDGVLACNCPPSLLQLGGEHKGWVDAERALRSFFVEFGVSAVAVDDIVVDGAHIVVNYHMSLQHVGTGRVGRVSGLNHYVLDARRKISKCNIFMDNASLAVVGDLLDRFAEVARGFDTVRRRRGGGADE